MLLNYTVPIFSMSEKKNRDFQSKVFHQKIVKILLELTLIFEP